tara:strand:- start:3205 stop:3405 length:201 start_codon:yes stop_codon:yes gene_type:complete
MNIILNNTKEEIQDGITVQQLLHYKKINNKYMAVEINRNVIPKSDHQTYVIQDGDKIEIITAIGGG